MATHGQVDRKQEAHERLVELLQGDYPLATRVHFTGCSRRTTPCDPEAVKAMVLEAARQMVEDEHTTASAALKHFTLKEKGASGEVRKLIMFPEAHRGNIVYMNQRSPGEGEQHTLRAL